MKNFFIKVFMLVYYNSNLLIKMIINTFTTVVAEISL